MGVTSIGPEKGVQLWVDDVRRPPSPEWIWAKTVAEAIDRLATGSVVKVSLDNDLYPFEQDGLEICHWMEETATWPGVVHVHTDNKLASMKICGLLKRNGYRKAPGRSRTFVRTNGKRMAPAQFAASSHRGSPRAMKRLREDGGQLGSARTNVFPDYVSSFKPASTPRMHFGAVCLPQREQ